MKIWKSLLSVACLMTLSASVNSAQEGGQVVVTGILTDDNNYGGCMAKLSSDPQTWGSGSLNCAGPGGYVTMDCFGLFGSKSNAQTKLAAAQLSLVTGKYVYIIADDTQKHNDYCLAVRIDNLSISP